MNRERSLKIVLGHAPLHMPAGAEQADLTAAVGLVLSTVRSGVPDMVLDHELWLACVRAVAAVVNATSSEVHAKPNRRPFEALRGPRVGDSVGSLDSYGERLLADPSIEKVETDVWGAILWWRGGDLVAAATREDWFAVGGPPLYHDSYTTSISVRPADLADLEKALALQAERAGGWVESIVG
jgi:hypothetical protein